MQRLPTAGQSLRQIAAELTRRGFATKKRRGKWSHKAVASILSRAA
jgi:hypothetical protein